MTYDPEERFERGLGLMRDLLGVEIADTAEAGHAAPAREVGAELLDWSVENVFGFILQRPGLSMRDKLIVLISSDVASAVSAGALADHVRWALRSGVTVDEVREICMLLVWYVGMPRVREAMKVIDEVVG